MLKVLLIVEQCNPDWTSVPLIGYRYYSALSRLAEVTLVTHKRNQAALARAGSNGEVVIIDESRAVQRYYRAVARIAESGGHTNWPLLHVLSYPVYAEFDRKVFRRFHRAVSRGDYDVVHAFSPVLPRYPVKMVEACEKTPFVLGPVNGGLAFPDAFAEVAQKEFNRFNFLRGLERFLPGYRNTYRRAGKILAGSAATLAMLRKQFDITDDRIELFSENGVPKELFTERIPSHPGDPIRLMFAGRLVPYKCADIVLDAMSRLGTAVTLTIVGDGPESDALKRQAQNLGLGDRVTFTGWLPQQQALEHYRQSDIFCFPSIREFGGAVVLEAMAAGLPCIVTDYGGIAEYVTDEAGFRIAPISRDHLRDEMARLIETLVGDPELRRRMSAGAVARARSYEWNSKARRTLEIYAHLLENYG